jgi:MinD-like ATPase involved in chromosome partitioning or flagellar assembly
VEGATTYAVRDIPAVSEIVRRHIKRGFPMSIKSPTTKAKVRLVEDDDNLFVERNGKRIAQRGVGRHAKQWISLEPGFVVYGDDDLVIEQHGAALH